MNGDGTQNEPIQDQHSQSDEDKVAGILAQEEADLAGHSEHQVLDALRERFADAGHTVSEEALQDHARRIAGLDPNDFSSKTR
ncbi:hypothetical protein E3O53_13560 [Cryobacterium sp. TMT2-18-3]|uniref:hypothetical protein n=1 Tax=unclassified Cryobacterium TaxID=2649013 RepID=UPI00106C4FE7|nr:MULTISPECIES: hypothetical protein [unclassified Cryobacterium]TFC32286.1 hypothetical protein E3O22_00040 [Cryobacterium sp. TMT2-18-2]TFC37479.1 hypothetical protein E3O18_05440 [Cryobacterium sp. TMT2-42-4]TFC39285.1 hypothetical protein E3O18_02105 [Cryobacterium sp. TMT2-42-4]TFC61573.1 hypothetical protein E3O53_13560 [Cryobacterium sp. TMT2-18-3]TFC62261.1 hypothetical protein E3O62_04275 [Cryobacterium sp. TMT2-15-1]